MVTEKKTIFIQINKGVVTGVFGENLKDVDVKIMDYDTYFPNEDEYDLTDFPEFEEMLKKKKLVNLL